VSEPSSGDGVFSGRPSPFPVLVRVLVVFRPKLRVFPPGPWCTGRKVIFFLHQFRSTTQNHQEFFLYLPHRLSLPFGAVRQLLPLIEITLLLTFSLRSLLGWVSLSYPLLSSPPPKTPRLAVWSICVLPFLSERPTPRNAVVGLAPRSEASSDPPVRLRGWEKIAVFLLLQNPFPPDVWQTRILWSRAQASPKRLVSSPTDTATLVSLSTALIPLSPVPPRLCCTFSPVLVTFLFTMI